MNDFKYVGSELDLFADVWNWKSYWAAQIRPFLKGDILEVGAGLGSNTKLLDTGGTGRWVCLEPDAHLIGQLTKNLAADTDLKRAHETICGTLAQVAGQQFDTMFYIDVLEHIEKDGAELNLAATHLRPGGHLIVLSPAHQWLFSPFDKAIGHFRRYNKAMIRKVSPAALQLVELKYLDSVGMSLSAANMLLLKQSMPTKTQLSFWDRWVVPISRLLDKPLGYSIGKTIIAVWRKPQTATGNITD
jgi:SAM-dependent methyltransferase